MAKVWGPLHSDDARGKLADSVVYIGWRGIKDVRMWKKPKNPRTSPQTTQRELFTSAVDDYHTLKAGDQTGWKLKASGQPFTGFNLYVGDYINVNIAGFTWNTISSIVATPAASIVTVKFATQYSASARLQMGTTRGTWTIEQTPAGKTDVHAIKQGGLASASKYYYMLSSLTASVPSESGHHIVETT